MSKPELGDRILITDGTYGGCYGIFVGQTIGLGKRGKVRLDFDQKIHRLSYTKMLVLPEAAIVDAEETNPPNSSPSPTPATPVSNGRFFSPGFKTTTDSSDDQSELTRREEIESKLSETVAKLVIVEEQFLSLRSVVMDLQALLLSHRVST